MAAVGHQAVGGLSVLAKQRRHRVADLRVDRKIRPEQAVPHVLVEKLQIVLIEFLQALVKERNILERIDVHGELSLVVLRQHKVPLKIALSVRHQLLNDVQQLFSLDDEHAHTGKIILRRAVVNRQINDLSALVYLQCQRLRVPSVGSSRLCYHCQITPGSHMRVNDLREVDRTQNRRIRQNDIFRVASL